MKRLLASVLASLCIALPAHAALDIGDAAPDFTTPAALAGKVYEYSLAESLKKGPVVLYFFPAAYSEGCSVEAHTIVYHYLSLNPTKHVEKTLAALRRWSERKGN